MEDIIYKHKKKIVIAGALVFVLIIAAAIGNFIWNEIYSATINIMVAPSIAKVKLDGKEYGVVENFRFKPGEYTAEIFAEGFISKTVNVVAKKR